ncbi:PREDICTED: odorant receptor 22c-like [Dinoponera quadriceps]|uniref:Odorant receptor n=1 Tax=Dinoponera quadriceps TaxID=609295 RepID=A0A6P3XZ31_DINQU|nr:PREDICTED: odorant receptor 22c-like [Dinoponera quadriceps]
MRLEDSPMLSQFIVHKEYRAYHRLSLYSLLSESLTDGYHEYGQSYVYVFTHFKLSELQYLADSLPGTLYFTVTTMKMIIVWKYHRLVREILAAMDTDWRECVNVDDHLHLMRTRASFSSFCTKALFGYNTLSGGLYFGGNNLNALFDLVEIGNGTSRPLPVSVVLPFEADQSPIYELLVAVLFLHSMTIVYMVNFLSTFLLTLLKSISNEMPHYESVAYRTKILVEKHNKVISFSENLDKLLSFMALMQIFWNTLVFCFLGLHIVVSIHNAAGVILVKAIIAYFGIMMEIFIFCFAGEYLTHKSRSLGDAGYESLWYNMSPSLSKNILFFIMRSQKQLTLTAGGMTILSLEAFTSIMKASASYISVLNAMY